MEISTLFTGAVIGSFITATIVAIITGIFNLRSKNIEYENSYSKMILERRLNSYEQLNVLINTLYKSVLDGADSKAYHIVFHSEDSFNIFFKEIHSISTIKFWLSDRSNDSLKNFFKSLQGVQL
jgi:hypothetical protein